LEEQQCLAQRIGGASLLARKYDECHREQMGAGRQQSAAGSGADVHRWPSIIASSSIFCARFSALSLTFVRMFRCIDTLLFLSISIFASTKWHGTKSTRSTLPCTFTFSLLRHSILADHAATRSRSGPSSRLRSCHEHEHSTTRLRSCHEHEHSTTRLRSCHEHEHSTTRFSPDHIKHQTRHQSKHWALHVTLRSGRVPISRLPLPATFLLSIIRRHAKRHLQHCSIDLLDRLIPPQGVNDRCID